MNIARIALAGLAGIALTTAVACGNDDDAGSGPTDLGSTPNVATSPGTNVEEESPVPNVEVVATDFAFAPTTLTATAGEAVSITLDNQGAAPHTMTLYEDEAYATAVAGADTQNVAGGATGGITVTFDEAQTYYFRCEVHPAQMEGTIEVS